MLFLNPILCYDLYKISPSGGSKIVSQFYSRTPKKYDGTQVTTHRMVDLLPFVLAKVGEVYQQRSDLILAIWPEIIGPKLAGMTQAISFQMEFYL